MLDADRSWSVRVNRVFDTRPRDGADPHSVWLPRNKVEGQFSDLLYQDGVHVCVDGPSGTGKTSLVKTQLSKEKKKVISVQLTKSMKWSDLCREIVETISKVAPEVPIETMLRVEVIDKVKGSGRNRNAANNVARWRSVASEINERDLCRVIEASGAVLFVDDFEKAVEDIVVKVADICKLMTQDFNGKIVVAGTGDIYFQLMSKEPALESRLVAMSIGALPDVDDGWNFLCLGFDRLGIVHPGKIYGHQNASEDNVRKLRACKIAVHDAVASLPKALNEFGRKVCLARAQKNHRLGFADLEELARDTLLMKVDEYAKFVPRLRSMLVEKPEIRIVLGAIYRRNIGLILRTEDICRDSEKESLSRPQFEDALADLVEEKVPTRTGRNGETIFVTNLYLAHVFGVCAEKYAHYQLDPKLYGPLGQFSLPLRSK